VLVLCQTLIMRTAPQPSYGLPDIRSIAWRKGEVPALSPHQPGSGRDPTARSCTSCREPFARAPRQHRRRRKPAAHAFDNAAAAGAMVTGTGVRASRRPDPSKGDDFACMQNCSPPVRPFWSH
jgi:hypothetical protein